MRSVEYYLDFYIFPPGYFELDMLYRLCQIIVYIHYIITIKIIIVDVASPCSIAYIMYINTEKSCSS